MIFNQIKGQLKMNKPNCHYDYDISPLGCVFPRSAVSRFPSDPPRNWTARRQQEISDLEIPLLKQQPPPFRASRVFVLGGHGKPQHRTRLSHGDVAAQRHGAGCGGAHVSDLPTSAELADPASGTWTATGGLNAARYYTRRPCCPTGWCWLRGIW